MNIRDFIDCRISNLKLSYLRYLIAHNVQSYDTVMDIGSGNKILDYVEWKELYRVDPTITVTRKYHDTVGTWEDAINMMSYKQIDCVFLMDVIEHLRRGEAMRLLNLTTHHAKQVVVFTPLGFMTQDDGEWNTHRSGWVECDFDKGWNAWVIKDFHTVDFKGNKLEKPVSALLAIYTKP